MNDIKSRDDITILINTFYSELLKIEEIKSVFAGIDFPAHIPYIVSFWSLVLLDEEGYKTNVFDKHINLPIKLHMFDIWLDTWIKAVESLFEGQTAELAKLRAGSLTYTFKAKWETMKK